MKKFSKKRNFYGQATIEYLLLIALVVGILLSSYQKQVKGLLTDFKSRQTQYTDVVEQKNLGIPLAWFGGKYGNIGANTAGGVNSGAGGANAGQDNQGDGAFNGGQTDGALNSGNTSGNKPSDKKGDTGDGDTGGDTSGDGGDPSRRSRSGTGPSNLALNNSKDKGGRLGSKGKGGGEDDDGGDFQDDSGFGGRGRRRGSTALKSEGSLRGDETKKDVKKEDPKEVKAKEKKEKSGDEEIQKMKEVYGSSKEKKAGGGCSNLDLSALIKVGLVLGLLFVLFGMLSQKRGDGQD